MSNTVTGSKGSSSSSATVASDTLSSTAYAQVVDLISEGPVYGPANGTFAQSLYLDGTPLENADSTLNFTTKATDFRLGTGDQTYMSGSASTEDEVSVNVALKASNPWVHTVTNLNLNALRVTLSVAGLSQTNTSSGNVTGYRVAYQIQVAVDSGAYSTVVDTAFDGKASSTYTRSHRIELSGAASQYTVRVVRTTADTTSNYIQDSTTVVSYTELIDAKLRYPFSAVASLQFDASQFSSVPVRSYLWKGRLISYPSNYDPVGRTYSGTWDGTFVTGWTNNPAWVFYDLALNPRYGAGKWIDVTQLDRYALYTIAQYCDVLVSDGKGGTEPRFTCNAYIQSRSDAFKVLQDLASVFRGMAYWSAGAVTATADMPLSAAYVYTKANTVGKFSYVGSSMKTRYTVALVTWNDPDNAYAQAVEYVEDADGVARYGINKAETTAFGCTSRGQAQRAGHWILLTSRYETNVCTWTVGLDGTIPQPGQIVAIADPARAGIRLGGRLVSVTDYRNVVLDKAPDGVSMGDTLTLNQPSGVTETRTVASISGATVTVSAAFSALPVAGSVWLLERTTVKAQYFRVSSVEDKGGIEFTITGTQYEASKYAAIDNGAAIDVSSITATSYSTQAAPTNVKISQYVVTNQGIAVTNATFSWDAADGAIAYSVQWKRDSLDWVDAGTTSGLSIDVPNVYAGAYQCRVKAINGLSITSVYSFAALTTLAGKTTAPPVVATLTATTNKVLAVEVDWTFPTGATDTSYTEIWYSHTADFTTSTQLGLYSYPTSTALLNGLASGYTLYFWARLVDKTGNVGAWYPDSSTPGVQGMSNDDGTAILSYLSGQISQTQLASDLVTVIDSIPGIQQTVTDTASALSSETSARQTADSALATRIDKVEASYVVPEYAGSTTEYAGSQTTYAGVWSEQTARATADLALGTRIDTVTAQLTNSVGVIAAVQTQTQATANATSALATQTTTLQATVDSNTASIATTATATSTLAGQVAASYAIRTQVTYDNVTYLAGIGIGIDNTSGTVQSQVLVSADRFAVLNSTTSTSTTLTSPFVVQNGSVYISQALIGTAWITNAMIGAYIQSDNYVSGSTGWQINKAGTIELNGVDGGGGRTVFNASGVNTYDASGVNRVTLGRIS